MTAFVFFWGVWPAASAEEKPFSEFLEPLRIASTEPLFPKSQPRTSEENWSDFYLAQAGGKASSPSGGKAAGGAPDVDELSRKSANPLGGDFMVWINEIHIDFLQGDITDRTRHSYTHIFQPVIPFPLPSLGPDWIWVNRPTLPIIYSAPLPKISRPGAFPAGFGGTIRPSKELARNVLRNNLLDFEDASGFGDLIYFTMVGRSIKTKFEALGDEGDLVIAGGLTTQWPTGSDEFSQDAYAAGPVGVVAWMGKKYIFGALAQHWWDYSHSGSSDTDVNSTSIQYFYFVNLPGGWSVGAAPQIAIDWEQDSDNRWSVPIGLGFTKMVFLGKMPVKIGVEFDYFVARQDSFGPEWKIKFSIVPITPNFINNLFKYGNATDPRGMPGG
jgi:hypothetical protein